MLSDRRVDRGREKRERKEKANKPLEPKLRQEPEFIGLSLAGLSLAMVALFALSGFTFPALGSEDFCVNAQSFRY